MAGALAVELTDRRPFFQATLSPIDLATKYAFQWDDCFLEEFKSWGHDLQVNFPIYMCHAVLHSGVLCCAMLDTTIVVSIVPHGNACSTSEMAYILRIFGILLISQVSHFPQKMVFFRDRPSKKLFIWLSTLKGKWIPEDFCRILPRFGLRVNLRHIAKPKIDAERFLPAFDIGRLGFVTLDAY